MASPWKMSLWIFISAEVRHPAVNFTYQFFCGFCDEVHDFIEYFIHFKTSCYPSLWDHIIGCFFIIYACHCYIQACGCKKIRLTRRFNFISLIEINKINKGMEHLCRLTGGYLVGGKRLLWSGLTVLSSNALSDGWRFKCSCDLCLPYLYILDIKHRFQKTLFVEKKMIGWKIDLFL